MDITTLISSIMSTINIGKAIKDINKSYDEATYKATIADFMEKLSEARLTLIEAKEQISEKDKEIISLRNLAIERDNLIEGDGGYLYQVNDDGAPVGFPICPNCDPIHERLIKLVQNGTKDAAKCPACATEFDPVTCYLPVGGTQREQRIAESRRKNEEMNRLIRNHRTSII